MKVRNIFLFSSLILNITISVGASALTDDERAQVAIAAARQAEHIRSFRAQIEDLVTSLHPEMAGSEVSKYANSVALSPKCFSAWDKLYDLNPEGTHILSGMLVLLKESGVDLGDRDYSDTDPVDSSLKIARLILTHKS
jgi:hypothetical protein